MFASLPEALKLTTEHKQFLQNLGVSADSPGSVLRDFGTLIDFERNNELRLTGKHQLSLGVLADINTRLTTVDGTGKQPVLVIDDDMVQQWENLNPTERYGTLLEAWLLRGKPEIDGERERPFGMLLDNFERSTSFYVQLPGDELPVAGNRDAQEGLRYRPEWYKLGLLDLFGLIRIEHGPLEPGKGWQIERIHRTLLGDALLALLYSKFFSDFDNLFRLEDEGKMCRADWQQCLASIRTQHKRKYSLMAQLKQLD